MTPKRTSITRRFVLLFGLAAVVSFSLLATVFSSVYSFATDLAYARLQEVSHRYATEFQAGLEQKLGLLKGFALALSLGQRPNPVGLLDADSDFSEAWIQWSNDAAPQQLYRANLWSAVLAQGHEVLSEPDFIRFQASLGVPIVARGVVVGLVGVSFSLRYFHDAILKIRLYRSGYAVLVSHRGYRIAHPVERYVGVRLGNDISVSSADELLTRITSNQAFYFDKPSLMKAQWSRQFFTPVTVGRVSTPWYMAVVAPVSEVTEGLDSLIQLLVLGSILFLLVAFVLAWKGFQSILRPLRIIAATAETVAGGNLSARVAWSSSDELGTVSAAFNRMTDRLVTNLREQASIVEERTLHLQSSLADLGRTQATLRASERMAILGQMATAVAHEVNTPLGAIRSSATFLHHRFTEGLSAYLDFNRTLDEQDYRWYRTLVSQAMGLPEGNADRSRRQKLTRELQKLKLPDPRTVAEALMSVVPPDQDEAILHDPQPNKWNLVLRVAGVVDVVRACSILVEATDQASETVATLLNYTREPVVETGERLEVEPELTSVLDQYVPHLNAGLMFTLTVEPGLSTWGHRRKLGQLWSELIAHAVEFSVVPGEIYLGGRAVPQGVEVTVEYGPRTPKSTEVERLLQPTYHTNALDVGTGLGLSLCRQIVEAHQGTISVVRTETKTQLRIWLPSTPGQNVP